jgi:hypothetical protein
MSPLWLLLIVPFAAAIGYGVACFMWMADDSDEQTISLLYRQYSELCSLIKPVWPSGLADIKSRHEAERKALDE